MDNESRFWLSFWAMCGLCFVAVVAAISSGNFRVNQMYYAAQSECVAKGMSWVPTRGYNALCIRTSER